MHMLLCIRLTMYDAEKSGDRSVRLLELLVYCCDLLALFLLLS